MGLRIIDRKVRSSRKGAKVDPEHKATLASESERLFGSQGLGHTRYKNTFAEKAERVRRDFSDDDALEVLTSHAGNLIKGSPLDSTHSQLPVDIGTLLDLL